MKIGIASDHRGFELKQYLTKYLISKGYNVVDYGTDSKESVDYPDFAFKMCEEISPQKITYGIAICGSAIGISIACNKVKGIRCAKVDSAIEAKLTREHNDANVVALSGEMPKRKAVKIVNIFLTTAFSNEERHLRRINKIKEYENRDC